MGKKKNIIFSSVLVLAAFVLFTYFFAVIVAAPNAFGDNATYVETKVNVTNTEPNITAVVITPDPLTLTANGYTTVFCNATIFEYNGVDDINLTNATFYDSSVKTSGGADDKNDHYTNSSCDSCTTISSTNFSCECGFSIAYYANNGSTWECNFTVVDDANFTSSLTDTGATINGLIAIQTPSELDFGNLTVSQTSEQKELNITNVGNIDLNISVRGFANETGPDNENLSMNCEYGFIEDYYERYSTTNTSWADMLNITNSSTMLNLSIAQKTEDNVASDGQNATYWKLQIPWSVGGFCNGSLEFIGTDATY